MAVVFIIHCEITLHVSGALCTHHQEYIGHDIVKYTPVLEHLLTDLNLHHIGTWFVPVIASTVLMYSWWWKQRAPKTCGVILQWITKTTAVLNIVMFWGSLQVCMFICSSDDDAAFVQFVICHWYVAVASLSNFLNWLMLMNWYVVLHSVSILFFLFFFCSYPVIPEDFVLTASLFCVICVSHSVCFCYYSLKGVFGFIPYSFLFLSYCCMWDKVCSLDQILYLFPSWYMQIMF